MGTQSSRWTKRRCDVDGQDARERCVADSRAAVGVQPLDGVAAEVRGGQRGQGPAHAVAGEPECLPGPPRLDDRVEPVADLGEGLHESGVDLAPRPVDGGEELAVDPEVVLVQEDHLGRVEQAVDLEPGAPEDDDDRGVAREDHAAVVVRGPEPLEAKALSGQGRGQRAPVR